VVAILDRSETDADAFCAGLEEAVRQKSGGQASITTTYVEYDGTGFRDKLKLAFRKIHTEKDGRQNFGVEGSALLTSPYYHRCSLLPTQPARYPTVIGEIGDEEERYLSEAAKAQWVAVKEKKKIEFDVGLLQKLGKPDCWLPYQLDDLWRKEEGGYMGFIAADGNNIGQMLEIIGDECLYEEFSNQMYDLVWGTIAEAAMTAKIPPKRFVKTKKSKQGSSQKSFLPLIPVIVAGDDLSLLVRAEDASRFAAGLCCKFTELSKGNTAIQQVINLFCRDSEYSVAARQLFPDRFTDGHLKLDTDETWKQPQTLTLSVGVAIAKRKFPMSVYRRLAGELRDEAKQALRKRPDAVQEGGMIDLAVITTATAQSLRDLRSHYWTDEGTHLTIRPCTIGDFEELLKLAELLKELPRNKRKFLYTQLFSGIALGQAAYQFVMARERKLIREKVFNAMEAFDCKSGNAFRPAANRPDEKETPLVDALELAELMEMED